MRILLQIVIIVSAVNATDGLPPLGTKGIVSYSDDVHILSQHLRGTDTEMLHTVIHDEQTMKQWYLTEPCHLEPTN